MLHSIFPKVGHKFLSMPLLGPVADGFDDWLAANGYTRRQAIARVKPAPSRSRTPWSKDRTILDWLESL